MPDSTILFLDGDLMPLLHESGMPGGMLPELFGAEHPDLLEAIHRRFIAAGSQVIYGNTGRLASCGLDSAQIRTYAAVNMKAAVNAADGKVKTALVLGPLAPETSSCCPCDFEEAYGIYARIIEAGAIPGTDLIALEGIKNLQQARAAVIAAGELTSLPVWVSMEAEKQRAEELRTTALIMAMTMEGLGVKAFGINGLADPQELLKLLQYLRSRCSLPFLIRSDAEAGNSGKSRNASLSRKVPHLFRQSTSGVSEYSLQMSSLLQPDGIAAIGGGSGTRPEHIRALSLVFSEYEQTGVCERRSTAGSGKYSGICSYTRIAGFGRLQVIGNRISPLSSETMKQALTEGNLEFAAGEAVKQKEEGADILRIQALIPDIPEAELLAQLVREVQKCCDLPLMIESGNLSAIEAALRVYCGRALVSMGSADRTLYKDIFPIVKKYGAAVAGSVMVQDMLPVIDRELYESAARILYEATACGVRKEDVLICCMPGPVRNHADRVREMLRGMALVQDHLGLEGIIDLDEVCEGLPAAQPIASAFLTAAVLNGINLPVVNPADLQIMDAAASVRVLTGQDAGAACYIDRMKSRQRRSSADDHLKTIKNVQVGHMNPEMTVMEPVRGLEEISEEISGQLRWGEEPEIPAPEEEPAD